MTRISHTPSFHTTNHKYSSTHSDNTKHTTCRDLLLRVSVGNRSAQSVLKLSRRIVYVRNLNILLTEIMPVYYIKLRVRYMKITKQVSSYVRSNAISNVQNKLPFFSKPNQHIFNRNAKERQQIKKSKAMNISRNRHLNKLLLSDDQQINLIAHSGSKSIRIIKYWRKFPTINKKSRYSDKNIRLETKLSKCRMKC
jgi:hypothetical protein